MFHLGCYSCHFKIFQIILLLLGNQKRQLHRHFGFLQALHIVVCKLKNMKLTSIEFLSWVWFASLHVFCLCPIPCSFCMICPWKSDDVYCETVPCDRSSAFFQCPSSCTFHLTPVGQTLRCSQTLQHLQWVPIEMVISREYFRLISALDTN